MRHADESATIARTGAMDVLEKTFCEFFAGIGLVREGLSVSGWRCVYANDVNPKKREMYLARFGEEAHFHLEDVHATKEVVSRIPESPFLATASFPCVDLSLAGHWRGLKGEHSSTFFGFVQAIEALGERRPTLVMLENVVGFITSHEGKDFASVVQALAELGYWIDAFVIDAKHFVPQSRPRVFVVGLHENLDAPFAARKMPSDWVMDGWMEAIDARPTSLLPDKLAALMKTIVLPTGWTAFPLSSPRARRGTLASLIDLGPSQEWWDDGAVRKHHDMMSDRHRNQVDALIESGETFVGTIFRRKRHGKTRAEVRFDGTAGCLRTPRGGSARQIIVVVEGGNLRMRWMSAREYARLQGADDFPLVENTIQNLYGFGDAVCVPVVRHIDQHILTPVFEAARRQDGFRDRQSYARTAP